MIPKYVKCWNEKVKPCEFYMHRDCPESCAYAEEITQLGIGAFNDAKGLLENKLKLDEIEE